MKPSDFQKTVQCRFESCLKKVVRSVVKDYYKELNRRKNKEISFSELPDVLVDKMAVWDDYETDYTIFSVCGIDIRVLDDELAEALKKLPERILKNRGKAQPLIVGGYSNFLFLNREGLPKVAGNYEGMVRGLIKKYNKYHTDKLPNITPHSFRHTYCTNMANRGMNPNTLQYLMGHANITMTLGYYAHGTFQSAKAELERLAC